MACLYFGGLLGVAFFVRPDERFFVLMATSIQPPGPRHGLQAYFAFRRNPLEFLTRIAAEYGDIVHMQVGNRHDYLLNHPDYIKQVLMADEGMGRSSAKTFHRVMRDGLLVADGTLHHRNRKLLLPLFHHQNLTGWCATIAEHAERTRDRWRAGEQRNMAGEMLGLALGIILRLLIGMDIEKDARGLLPPLHTMCDVGNQNTFPTLLQLLLKRPASGAKQLQAAIAETDVCIYRAIAERRAHSNGETDILAGLLRIENPEDGSPAFNDDQIRDELMTLILAGHETIGNAMVWSWYLVAGDPEVEARMHEEVDRVLAGRLPTAADLPRLLFVESILTESMRLYPPVWVFPRRPLQEYEIGGFTAPAGSYFQLSPYVTQRDARYFPEPEKFDPDRWSSSDAISRNKFTYFPFAGGMHRCIGEGFAIAEGVLVLATIAQRWRLRLAPGQRVEPEAVITLRPRGGLPMTLEAR
jgi:cytochrome P450